MGSPPALSACGKCLKIFFIIINLLYLLIGLALIGVGSYLVASGNSFSTFTSSSFDSAAAILIICGIVIFVITATGIVGAFFHWKYILYLYVIVMVIIIILEIVATILGFVFRDRVADTATDNAIDAIGRYLPPNDTNFDKNVFNDINNVQETFECCGWGNGSLSLWLESPYYDITMMFPDSCRCNNETSSTECIVVEGQSVYNKSCDNSLADRLRGFVVVGASVAVAFGVAQILPILLAIGLLCAIHKNAEYVTV